MCVELPHTPNSVTDRQLNKTKKKKRMKRVGWTGRKKHRTTREQESGVFKATCVSELAVQVSQAVPEDIKSRQDRCRTKPGKQEAAGERRGTSCRAARRYFWWRDKRMKVARQVAV